MGSRLLLFLLTTAVFAPLPEARAEVGVTVTGSWSEAVDESDLTAGPGSNLASEYQSASNEFSIRIQGFGASRKNPNSWRLDVRRSDANWHANLSVFVRRTSNGSGTGSISGGTSYQTVTGTDQTFFQGSNDRNGVRVQAKVGGVSLSVPPSTYQTSIVFTIVDT